MQNRTTGIRRNRGLTELNIFIYLLKISGKGYGIVSSPQQLQNQNLSCESKITVAMPKINFS